MSNSSPKQDASTPITTASLAAHAKTRLAEAYTTPWVVRSTQLILLVALFSGSAMAQTELGSLYCDTAVEDIINVVFTAFAGLGLPATMFFVSRSGLEYMRSSGNPNQQNAARQDLILSGTGFMIIVLAVVSPELIDKFGASIGIGFSDCVKPFSFS